MQEQTPYNTSPEQGWSQMKALLDQEMPVQKRSRRMVFFWWSFISLMLIGLTSTVAFQQDWMQNAFQPLPLKQDQQHQNLQQPIQDTDKEIKKQNSQKEKMEVSNNEFAANTSSIQAASIDQNKLVAVAPKSNKSDSAIQNTNHRDSSNKQIGNERALSSVASGNALELSSGTVAIEPTDEISMTDEQKDPEVLTNITVLHQGQNEVAVTESVPSLDMTFFTIPEDALGPVMADEFTPVAKHHPSINPGAEANVLSGFQGGMGWYAGAAVDIKLASRLSLTTGIGYREFNPGATLFSFQKSADVGTGISSNELVKIDTISDGFYVPSEAVYKASYEELDPVIESVHQWQASAGMDWRFSKRFSLEGGFGIAFRTRAFSEYPIVPLNYANNSFNSQFSNSLEGYEVVRQTMTSCFAGLSYHIGKHIALKAQWFHTFQPYLDTDRNELPLASSTKKRDDFIRGITLGVKYSIL